jgi:protocatechuate 3,4-dioxygenase beta subunit
MENYGRARQATDDNTGRFVMFSVITNIYNKKTKRPTLMEFFTATRKLKKKLFYN